MSSEVKSQSPVPISAIRKVLIDYTTRTQLAVIAITILAVIARLIALGTRVAHLDEARVAYWALRYAKNGVYEYRPIVHGPFLTIVDSHLFELLGSSDFTMRLIVALIGGLLPLTALLFRERLRDSETVALSLLLAANPLLLYYSRFYRNDLLLAGFMLTAFGFYIRAYDTRRPVYLYIGTAIFALAFTTKENALIYPVTWAGATVLLWDHQLILQRPGERGLYVVRERIKRTARGVWDWWPYFTLAIFEFFAIVIFFYAPRRTDLLPHNDTPGLYEALGNPILLPAVVNEALLGSWNAFVGQWGSGNQGSYFRAVEAFVPVLREAALVLLALALVGLVVDRYSGDLPRDVVAFTAYWGFASALGYPVIVDNPFPWEMIHVIMPLAVPGAVGLAFVGRLGRDSLADGDAISATAVAVILLVAAGQVGVTAYNTSFTHSQSPENELVQYAQPSSEMKPLLHEMQRIIRTNDGVDVLFYGDNYSFDGDELYAPNPSSHNVPPAGDGWFERLPFAWYMEMYGAETNSTNEAERVKQIVTNGERPPIVITFDESTVCADDYDNTTDIDQYMAGYESHEVDRFLYNSGCIVSGMVVYVDEDSSTENKMRV